MSTQITKEMVLSLYRNILKSSNKLKYTDKDYFKRRVRQEFELIGKTKHFSEQTRAKMYKKGVEFLRDGGII
jgi:hypothetical protein